MNEDRKIKTAGFSLAVCAASALTAAICLTSSSAANACQPSVCHSVQVCEPGMDHQRCHLENQCTAGTCADEADQHTSFLNQNSDIEQPPCNGGGFQSMTDGVPSSVTPCEPADACTMSCSRIFGGAACSCFLSKK